MDFSYTHSTQFAAFGYIVAAIVIWLLYLYPRGWRFTFVPFWKCAVDEHIGMPCQLVLFYEHIAVIGIVVRPPFASIYSPSLEFILFNSSVGIWHDEEADHSKKWRRSLTNANGKKGGTLHWY